MNTTMVLVGLTSLGFLALPASSPFGNEVTAIRGPAASAAVESVSVPVLQSQCRFEAQRELRLPIASSDALRLLVGSGSLVVVGIAGREEVTATARACASEEEFLEDLQLSSGQSGGSWVIEARTPVWQERSASANRYARLDLRVEVPEGTSVDIRDTSGDISVSGLGFLVIEDSSGNIEGLDLLDSVRIEDTSGNIVLRDVTGEVRIDDGSGDIHVTGVGGDVAIEDGAGEIHVMEVEGTAVIRDGSGGIWVDGVGRDLIVERAGSGILNYQNVQGRVRLPGRARGLPGSR